MDNAANLIRDRWRCPRTIRLQCRVAGELDIWELSRIVTGTRAPRCANQATVLCLLQLSKWSFVGDDN
jgi:hypothetical protein